LVLSLVTREGKASVVYVSWQKYDGTLMIDEKVQAEKGQMSCRVIGHG
jgi:hypothetical protein